MAFLGQWSTTSSPFVLFSFSPQVVPDSSRPLVLQHTRPPCPSIRPRVCSNSCPLSQWCHPTISSSVTPCFCSQSFPASESLPVSSLFASGGQSIGASASASVLPANIQGWFPLGLTGLISVLQKVPRSLAFPSAKRLDCVLGFWVFYPLRFESTLYISSEKFLSC